MRKFFAFLFNLSGIPIGFLLLRDFPKFLGFLVFSLSNILLQFVSWFLSFKINGIFIVYLWLSYLIFYYIIIIFFTIKSIKTYPERKELRKYSPFNRSLLGIGLVIFVIFLSEWGVSYTKENFFAGKSILSGSTEPNLQIGDYIYVNNKFNSIERGDFITYQLDPELLEEQKSLIKRVIGLPGDRIHITIKSIGKNKNILQIVINGVPLNTSIVPMNMNQEDFDIKMNENFFIQESLGDKSYLTTYKNGIFNLDFMKYLNQEITLEDNEYFLLGDNRFDSFDSLSHGPVHRDSIRGKYVVTYFSVNYKDNTCDLYETTLSEDYSFYKDCPKDFLTRIKRMKIRFHRIGFNG
jgi:signal peptidase I